MPTLNESSCRPGARLKNMFHAWEAGLIKHFINSFRVVLWDGQQPFVDRSNPYGEYTIYIPRSGGGSIDMSKFAFGYKLVSVAAETEGEPSTTACEITPGTIRFHGAGAWSLPDISPLTYQVALDPMSEPWVYAQMPRGGGTVSVSASSTEPISNTSTFKLPLYLFKRTDGGSYVLHPTAGGVRHIGDYNGDTPLL